MMEAGSGVAAVIGNAASGAQGEPGSGDVLEGALSPCITPDEEENQPDPHKSTTPTDKSPQESTTDMVRSDEVTELPAEPEPTLRSCVSTASMKVKNVKKLTFPRGHFPRLAECAHFHYETVDFGTVQLSFAEEQTEGQKAGLDSKEPLFVVQICCQSRSWLVKRSYEDFRVLDKHLHLCIYDRRFSKLTELPRFDSLKDTVEEITKMLAAYLSRLSAIADNKINCGPVLTWMEIDNKGNHMLVAEESSINVPAIAAAHVTKRYIAQATDELTFEVGDIVSVIDMPPKEDTGWWRGKHGFQVGFFPCDCVELISDRIPPCVSSSVPKPVCKKHGKLVTFLRSFMKSRPPPQKLRQQGILKERVFGCDLGEHLLNSGHNVPQVIKCCSEFIERHGVVDGMYRLSGISSNIQKLRHEFDSEQIPDLSRDIFKQDIHSVGSLCKLYFRELPNPLLTYQLYERFSEAVSAATDDERLVKIHNVIQQLPPPHYRTLEFLMRHLSQLATFSPITNMHTKNLAIVWAPNLLRSKQIESACFSGTAAFMEVRIQSVVVEFILNNTEALFSPKLNALIRESTGTCTLSRPKSLLVCSPSTKLLSLEEAQARTQAQLGSPVTTPVLSHSEYIEVGEGPGALMGKFHTVIELPTESKRAPGKVKKSPVGSWRSFFHLGKSSSMTSKRKLKRHPSEPNEIKSIALPGGRGDSGTLRSTKSEESLTSLHNVEGEAQMYRPPRPRSTSDALSTTFRVDLCDARVKGDRYHNQSKEGHKGADGPAYDPADMSPPHQEDDLDLCLPAPGMAFLDFDPMSFQCSPLSPPTTKSAPQRKASVNWRKNVGGSSESEPISSSLKVVSNSQSPDISPVHRKGGEKKKVSRVVSPKLRRKSSKSPPVVEADVHIVCASAPRCVSDTQGGESSSPPPLDLCEAPCRPPSPPSFASTVTDSLASQNPPDPGTDRLVNSVSVLPPHPLLTSAARRLALALAESAQKATLTSQRRSTQPPYPLHRQDTPHPLDRPPRPSVLHLQSCSQDYGDLKVSSPVPLLPLAGTPVESPCGRFPGHERKQAPEGQVAMSNFTATVSPLEAGALLQGNTEVRDQREGRDRPLGAVRPVHPQMVSSSYLSGRVSPPIQSVCSIQSQLAAAVLANTDSVNAYNYRTVLAEASMPGSVEEIPPRPPLPSLVHQYSSDEERAMREAEDVYRHHRVKPAGQVSGPHHPHPRPDCLPPHLAGPNSMYKPTSDSRYSTLGLLHHPSSSPQYRGQPQPREEYSSSGHHRSRGQWHRTEDRALGYPVIRRARSFRSQQPSSVQLAETEVLPPDILFYVQRPAVQEKEYQRLVQSDVQPLQPYFENGRVQYRYSPYSDAMPLEESYYNVDPYRTSRIRHSQSYTMRSTRDSGHPGYHYHPSNNIPPAKRELFLESRDLERVIYESWDHPEGCDRLVYHPIRKENRDRQRTQGPIMSPYENLDPPVPQSDIRGRDISHTRSRSDPGNACLLAIDRVDSQREVPAVSPISPGQQLSDPSDYIRHQRGHWPGEEPVPPRRGSFSRRTQSKQGTSQRHQPQHCNVPILLDVKNMEQGKGGPSRGCDQDKVMMGNAANSYSARLKPSVSRRQRSQSIKEPRYYHHVKLPVEPDHPGSFSTQPHRRTQSTKAMPSHYDNLEGYYPSPKPKPSGSGKAMPGPFPGHGCMPPHSHRLLSQALGGHRAFLQSGLRPEAGVYAE